MARTDSNPPFSLRRGMSVLVGMIHTGPLPGAPGARLSVDALARQAATEALLYAEAGFDAVLVENMHDLPYPRREATPLAIAAMTRIVTAVRQATPGLPCGVQILAGANQAALAVAHACGAHFIRCEGYVFGHLADEGWMDADAAPLARLRHQLGAESIGLWADIRKKHASHALTADLSAADWAKAAEDNLADAIVVTGRHTGMEADLDWLAEARAACQLPVVIGSGITAANIHSYLPLAEAFIVGTSVKQDGNWRLPPDPGKLRELRAAML